MYLQILNIIVESLSLKGGDCMAYLVTFFTAIFGGFASLAFGAGELLYGAALTSVTIFLGLAFFRISDRETKKSPG